jgi:hypothetical protein
MPAEIRKLQELAEDQDMLPALLTMPRSSFTIGCDP